LQTPAKKLCESCACGISGSTPGALRRRGTRLANYLLIDTTTMRRPMNTIPPNTGPRCCQGGDAAPDSGARRRVIKIAAAGIAAGLQANLPAAFAAVSPELRPRAGDRLAGIAAAGAGTPTPLKVADIPVGAKPVHAFPFDAGAAAVRDGSRFNKVLLVRLPPASLDKATRARSADGVLAFSAVCTHEGCDVSEWVPAENALLCFCHFTKFRPLDAGMVAAGPAPRDLPFLPLRSVNGEIEVAGAFSAAPGPKKLR
jgi:Rieske Fe-S protein